MINFCEGDLIRARNRIWGPGVHIEGRVHRFVGGVGSTLFLGAFSVDTLSGPAWQVDVIEKAERFYSNADREPVTGDVATTKWAIEGGINATAGPWFYTTRGWISRVGLSISGNMPATDNVLLVDGKTGLAL